MPAYMLPSNTPLAVPAGTAPEFHLADLHGLCFPFPDEAMRVQSLHSDFPLRTLHWYIGKEEITYGQWAVYVAGTLDGSIMNGGIDGFVGNRPDLLLDAQLLLADFGPEALAQEFGSLLEPVFNVMEAHQKTSANTRRDDLDKFWQAFANADSRIDDAKYEALEAKLLASRDESNKHPLRQLTLAVLDYVSGHPEDFLENE